MRGRVEVGVLWAPKQPLGEEGSVGEYGSGKHRGLLRLHRDGLGAVWGQDREARKCPGWGLEGGGGGGHCKNRASDKVMMKCSGSGCFRENH